MVKKHHIQLRQLSYHKELLSNILKAILVFAVLGTVIWLLWPKQINIIVKDFSWQYTIDIESYQTVGESGWHLPAGARLRYKREEFYEYQEVFDHYETKTRSYTEQVPDGYEYYYTDNGDGTATEHFRQKYKAETRTENYKEAVYRKEKVYKTKYYYDIDKWLHERYIVTRGNDKDPYWGEVKLLGEEREGTRSTQYNVICIVDEQEETYTCSEEIWNTLQADKSYVVKVMAGNIIEVIE